jgi:hypothetical protein
MRGQHNLYWIIRDGGERVGPVTWDVVEHWLSTGALQASDVVLDERGVPVAVEGGHATRQQRERWRQEFRVGRLRHDGWRHVALLCAAIMLLLGSTFVSQGPVGVTVLCFSPHAYDELLGPRRPGDGVATGNSAVPDQNAEGVLTKAAAWAAAVVGLLLYLACIVCAVAALRGRSKALRTTAWLVLALCACMVVGAVVQRNSAIHLYDPSHNPVYNFTHWGPD